MQPFVYHNPTKIVFGENTVGQIGPETRPFGRRAMLVYGRASIKQSGVYDAVAGSLRAAGLEVVEYGGVRANPVLSHLRAGIALAKQEKIEVVVAAGGGSVIDEAKAIAAGAVDNGDVWDFYTRRRPVGGALPLTTVLTLAATGTEMNGGTVITHDETREKLAYISPHCQPRVSILDPTTTYSVPANHTAYGAVDAMTHLLEGYFTHSDPWTPIQDRYVEGIVRTIRECVERVLADPRDAQGRATIMWAATLAWNGLALAGVGACQFLNHMLEHPLSGLYDVAHGAGLAVVLPAWMRHTAREHPARLAQFARNVLGLRLASEPQAAVEGARTLRAWFRQIGAPTTLTAAGIPPADIDRIAAATFALSQRWGVTRYTQQQLADIYRLCEEP
jgi:alcohol dehydrogenase YqhD (iron-dependent ADH family)